MKLHTSMKKLEPHKINMKPKIVHRMEIVVNIVCMIRSKRRRTTKLRRGKKKPKEEEEEESAFCFESRMIR